MQKGMQSMQMEETKPGEYRFQIQEIMGAQYRLPVLNFNAKPFSGAVDVTSKRKVDMYKNVEFTQDAKVEKQYRKKVNQDFTHFLSVPISSNDLQDSYSALKAQILSLKIPGVTDQSFMSSSMLHLSLINLNFQDDPERLTQAKSLIKQLETKVQLEILGAVDGNPPKPIYLTFKGLQTPQYLNPTQANTLHVEIKRDENYELLRKITNLLISEFLKNKIVEKQDMQNVNFEQNSQMWEVKLHLTFMKTKKGQQPFNASAIIDKFKDSTLGVVKLTELHLSNRHMIETFEGEKMLIKTEGGQPNLENGYFAHESKLYLSYDDFGF